VLDLEPANSTARKGIKTMERRVGEPTKAAPKNKEVPSAASGKRGGKGINKGG
jgi:hypothetical protein